MICWSTVLKSCWRSDLLGSFKKRDSGSCSPAESIFCGYVWLGGRTCHFTISQDFGAASPRSHHGHPLPLLRSDPGNLTPGFPLPSYLSFQASLYSSLLHSFSALHEEGRNIWRGTGHRPNVSWEWDRWTLPTPVWALVSPRLNNALPS